MATVTCYKCHRPTPENECQFLNKPRNDRGARYAYCPDCYSKL